MKHAIVQIATFDYCESIFTMVSFHGNIKLTEIENNLNGILDSARTNNLHAYFYIYGNQLEEDILSLPYLTKDLKILWHGCTGPKLLKKPFRFHAGYGGLYKCMGFDDISCLVMEASLSGLIQLIISKNELDNILVKSIVYSGVNPYNIYNLIDNTPGSMVVDISCDTDIKIDWQQAGYFNIYGDQNILL